MNYWSCISLILRYLGELLGLYVYNECDVIFHLSMFNAFVLFDDGGQMNKCTRGAGGRKDVKELIFHSLLCFFII